MLPLPWVVPGAIGPLGKCELRLTTTYAPPLVGDLPCSAILTQEGESTPNPLLVHRNQCCIALQIICLLNRTNLHGSWAIQADYRQQRHRIGGLHTAPFRDPGPHPRIRGQQTFHP